MNADVVAAYFARIGYAGSTTPSLAVLGDIAAHHLRAIPFESLGPFLGHGVDISPEGIFAKLVRSRRGGYCFEHNGLFHDVLATLGFRITPLAGRPIWGLPTDTPPRPLTHRMAEIDIGGDIYLADVGFGGQSPTAPLRLAPHAEQVTSHGIYRFLPHGEGFELQMHTSAGFAGLYRFTRAPQVAADYELGNWYTSSYPQGRFTQNLIAAIATDQGRWTLMNRHVGFRRLDGTAEEREVRSASELEGLLRTTFRIDPPVDAQIIWNKLPSVS